MDDELRTDSLSREVVHAAGAIRDISTDHEIAACEVLEDVCDQTRQVQQSFRELQVHDQVLCQLELTFLPSAFFVSSILQMDLWISKL